MGWLLKKEFIFLGGQKGFSLLELVISVAILGFIGTGVILALDTNARASRTLDEQVVATNLATAYLEALRELPYDNTYPEYSSAGDGINIPPGYSVGIDVVYTDNYIDPDEGTTVWVEDYTGTEKLQRIRVTVSREDGKPVLSICTFKTGFTGF
ncbi:prepilin-type N-terminal cleavage/methylation domain-containing protein [Chloroflexota bacterium]